MRFTKLVLTVLLLSCQALFTEPSLAEQADQVKSAQNSNYYLHVALTGVVKYMVFPGPPNFVSIEKGDYEEPRWILDVNEASLKRLVETQSSVTPSNYAYRFIDTTLRADEPDANLVTLNSFPGISGFSRSNVFHMKSFYLAYEKVQQAAGQFEDLPIFRIPWWHNVILIMRVKDEKQRIWYADMTIQEGWSRNSLENMIKSNYFARCGKAITNFKERLPSPQSNLAQEALKDPYNFDFIELSDDYREKELEQGLIDHIEKFYWNLVRVLHLWEGNIMLR